MRIKVYFERQEREYSLVIHKSNLELYKGVLKRQGCVYTGMEMV